ncbi:MAG: hypothetical protein QUV02_01360 [Maricaulis sp.]|uniref:hypothetical protein n=1 Tax=Maricaulis sp. TaxID=1486257 RepID=UPI001B2448CA|nr:hypothetical protein [Maricaulis sp.]MBO6730262.1 hypothetical protein [Maricaulis sp.]MBO6847386.1 hypothetical protein [Maricaulis sp.]MBO6876414.1 hypothetical protein [Maricaulis sp.]MDM7983069.1 hypothetical protein [Maricaulis sp.]
MRTLIIYTAVAGALYFVPTNQTGHASPASDAKIDHQVACVDALPELATPPMDEGESALRYCD